MSRIAVVVFADSTRGYEYLVPQAMEMSAQGDAPAETATHAVVPQKGGDDTANFVVGKIREFRDLGDQDYEGPLRPVVALFSSRAYGEHLKAQKRRRVIQSQIKNRLEGMSVLAQVKALGLDQDPEIAGLVEEFHKLGS